MYSPQYTITNKVLKNIGTIEAAREVIQHAPLLPFYEKKFQNEALIRSVHYGTHIEGNELNLSQAERVIMGQQVVARERDIQEVINYRKVIEFIGEWGKPVKDPKERREVSEELIKKLHGVTVAKILPEETSGTYRKTQVVIKNSKTGEVTFRPPLPLAVSFQVGDLVEFINVTAKEDMHPVLKSGIVHYELVRIHPFVDGNGRVARALSTLILLAEGYDIRKFFSLEEYFDSDAARYYDALQSVEKGEGNLTTWLEYFTEGLAVELTHIKEKIESVSVDAKIKEKLGGQPLMLSERQLMIVEYIQKNGYLENKAFKSMFPMLSEDSVLLDIKQLVTAGIIRKQGVTKGVKYVMV
ncbi:MAG: Fic family protein [Patescibacteria group bacterium]|nr:Fic family protein [Patescibacteria group bacterium]